MTITVVILLTAATLWLLASLRRRAARRAAAAAAAAAARARELRKSRVPEVSSNVKGVTASQTIEPVTSSAATSSEPKRVA